MLFILIFAKTIANLLHNNILYKAIISIIFILPLITVSSIQRGFLHGKENMFPASVTNVTEEIIKIILIITVFPLAVLKSNICAVITIILFNIITEASSIMIMSKAIKKYIDLCIIGDSTVRERYEIIHQIKAKALKQLEETKKQLDLLNFKEKFYENLIKNNLEDTWNPMNKKQKV